MTRSIYQFYTRTEAGAIVPNAEVNVFFAGAGEAPIYDAENGGNLIVQPLIATASAKAVFYIEPGIYDVQAKDPILLTTATFADEEIGTSREALIDDNQHAKPFSPLNLQKTQVNDVTTTDLINSTKTYALDVSLTTSGFTTSGDGGSGSWIQNGVTGQTASQTPVQLDSALLNDGLGNQWALVLKNTIDPMSLGAQGVLAANDGPALNLALKILRELSVSLTLQMGSVVLDGGNRVYGTDISINATHLKGWNYKIQNLAIYGRCIGKAVLDCVGSRGGSMENVTTYGDPTFMPSDGIQFARDTDLTFGFCDIWRVANVSTLGFYSVAGFHTRSQESTTYDHCRFWNYNPDARAAIHTGTSNFPLTSDYASVDDASRSFINNKYTNIDYRYLPSGNVQSITNITNANPAVVTLASADFLENGDPITIQSVSGMAEINDQVYTVANKTGNTIELSGIDSAGFAAYTSGGTVVKAQTVPTVYIGRAEQHTFDTCYIVSQGQPQIEFGFPDSQPPKQMKFNILCEGAGMDSHIRFVENTTERYVDGFDLEIYNTHTNDSIFSSDSANIVHLKGADIKVNSFTKENPRLVDGSAKYKFTDASIRLPNASLTSFSAMSKFIGSVYDKTLEEKVYYNTLIESLLDGGYTPTVVSEVGAITSFTIGLAQFRTLGDEVFIRLSITVTDAGTGGGALNVSLPTSSSNTHVLNGRDSQGSQLTGLVTGAASVQVRRYDNTTAIATGRTITMSGVYRV